MEFTNSVTYWFQGVVRAINLDISTPLVKTSPGAASKVGLVTQYSSVPCYDTTCRRFESFLTSATPFCSQLYQYNMLRVEKIALSSNSNKFHDICDISHN